MIALHDIAWHSGAFRMEGVSFTVPDNTYGVLMGRTGSGKTTLLELLCGLRRPAKGRVLVDGIDVTDSAPGDRGIGYVPQDGALFPAMRVREQLGFALRIRGRPASDIESRTAELAEKLGITALLGRKPEALSGGERQRIAIGRAIAAKPRVLVLDEPLSAIDEELRDGLSRLLKELQRELQLTVLHITHSTREAQHLADRFYRLEASKVLECPLPDASKA